MLSFSTYCVSEYIPSWSTLCRYCSWAGYVLWFAHANIQRGHTDVVWGGYLINSGVGFFLLCIIAVRLVLRTETALWYLWHMFRRLNDSQHAGHGLRSICEILWAWLTLSWHVCRYCSMQLNVPIREWRGCLLCVYSIHFTLNHILIFLPFSSVFPFLQNYLLPWQQHPKYHFALHSPLSPPEPSIIH